MKGCQLHSKKGGITLARQMQMGMWYMFEQSNHTHLGSELYLKHPNANASRIAHTWKACAHFNLSPNVNICVKR